MKDMEKVLSKIKRLAEKKEFTSIDELNKFFAGKDIDAIEDEIDEMTPLRKAQELIYDAWEETNPKTRIKLAKQALELSQDCADAFSLLAEEEAKSINETIDYYSKAVEAGKRALGEGVLKNDVGHFWGKMETRPYMRALASLAYSLWEKGALQESICITWELLRLNPNDNQGNRYFLFTRLLRINDFEGIEKLLKLYDEGATHWNYDLALYYFKKDSDTEKSRSQLSWAYESNKYVVQYFSGRRKLPKSMPEFITSGEQDEAANYVVENGESWRNTDSAIIWMVKYCRK